MTPPTDIRDQVYLSGSEVQTLNFVNNSGRYVFRKYYRSGLRSHIFEVLAVEDIIKETQGEIRDGIRMFPRARPKKMFRILRSRFKTLESVFNEINKYSILLTALGPDLIAESEEFIVDYTGTGKSQIVLCGLQEYIEGEILDPWQLSGKAYLHDLFSTTSESHGQQKRLVQTAQKHIAVFVEKIRQMIADTGYIPDLAGIGNLILTPDARLKLVDINNIVEIQFNDTIPLDDKGYPSCDVSVDVLSILEKKILRKDIHMGDPLYRLFLSPDRQKKVKHLEKEFYKHLRH